jgi:hypothetical protein
VDDCEAVICDQEHLLPVDQCREIGKRWTGEVSGCCFNVDADCITGDDPNQSIERFALESLFHATNGEEWARRDDKWMTQSWICYWQGIECSGVGGQMTVNGITLSANNLKGTLPDALTQLNSLKDLDLSNNRIIGTIPEHFIHLTSLQSLRMHNNQLTGNVPLELFHLPDLQILDIRYNFLSGEVPSIDSSVMSLSCEWNCMCSGICPNRRKKNDISNESGLECSSSC